jgi:asparagine synthase (glutamine-hydrolysing)
MMTGVEARVPFLDLELASFARSIPSNMMLKGGQQKYIIRKAMDGILPREVINRPKAGFGSPIRAWFRKENEQMKTYFDKRRLETQGIFKADAVNCLYQKNISGKEDNAYTLFALLTFQIWWDIFMEGKQTYS